MQHSSPSPFQFTLKNGNVFINHASSKRKIDDVFVKLDELTTHIQKQNKTIQLLNEEIQLMKRTCTFQATAKTNNEVTFVESSPMTDLYNTMQITNFSIASDIVASEQQSNDEEVLALDSDDGDDDEEDGNDEDTDDDNNDEDTDDDNNDDATDDDDNDDATDDANKDDKNGDDNDDDTEDGKGIGKEDNGDMIKSVNPSIDNAGDQSVRLNLNDVLLYDGNKKHIRIDVNNGIARGKSVSRIKIYIGRTLVGKSILRRRNPKRLSYLQHLLLDLEKAKFPLIDIHVAPMSSTASLLEIVYKGSRYIVYLDDHHVGNSKNQFVIGNHGKVCYNNYPALHLMYVRIPDSMKIKKELIKFRSQSAPNNRPFVEIDISQSKVFIMDCDENNLQSDHQVLYEEKILLSKRRHKFSF